MLPEHSFSLHSPDSKKTFQIAVLTPVSDDLLPILQVAIWFLKHFETSQVHSETLHLKKDDMLPEKET